jgi:H+/Cl- antiporter ClcA
VTNAPADISDAAPSGKTLLLSAIPSVVIGIVAALLLWLIDEIALLLEHVVWTIAPETLGIAADSPWWIIPILTLTGLAVGFVLWLAPGHGGHDSATVELVAPVLPLKALPGVALVIILGLAGGVSLGPESPIIAINTAIAVALVARMSPKMPQQLVVVMTVSATVGALFGTPVASALLLTAMFTAAVSTSRLWDRLFLPLVAAGAGSVTMTFLGGGSLALTLPPYSPSPLDLATGSAVAIASALFAIAAAWALPRVHGLFRRLRHPVIYVTLGGLLLGILGALGGPITLFKGLSQMNELVATSASLSVIALVTIAIIKLLALLVSAAAGFRGGRIFPAVFIGVALGLIGNALMPGLPVSLAIAAGVLGCVLVASGDGWISLFIAVAVSGDIATLPMLCIIVLPTWLLVRVAPEMIVKLKAPEPEAEPTR